MKKIGVMSFLCLALFLAGCTAAAGVPGNSSSVPATGGPASTKLTIGSLPRIFDLALYAAEKEGIFEKNGIQVEIVSFRSVVERNNAFLAGALDGFVDSIYEAINLNKEGDNCRVVGHNLMPDMFEVVVSPASGISSPAQLKGREIATSTATIVEYALDTLLAAEGISNRDVSYVNVPAMPLRLEMMTQGKLPAAILTPPLSVQAIASGNRLLLDDRRQQLAGPAIIFSSSALERKAEAVGRFVQAWQDVVGRINGNPGQFRGLLVSTAQVPEALALTYEVPVFPLVRTPFPSELSRLMDWMKSKGMLKQDVPYDRIVDSRFLK